MFTGGGFTITSDDLVSVVIPARNAAQTLPAQLDALAEQHLPSSWEVIVVDSGSVDGTAKVVTESRVRVPNLRVMQCDRPGVSAARNAGVRGARGARILVCDADDRVSSGWARALVAGLDSWPLVGGSTSVDELNEPSFVRMRDNPVTTHLPVALEAMPYAIGANMGFRREVFEAIDGFDEMFVYGGDDVDFCWRAQQAGFELGFCPDAVVQYRLRATTSAMMRQQFRYAQANAQLYRRHRKLDQVPKIPVGMQLGNACRAAIALLQVGKYARRDTRPAYCSAMACYGGALAGCLRYHVFV